jgi:hypothetical protein
MIFDTERKYYHAWWANVDPITGKLNKGYWGYKESEAELITEMTKRGMGRNMYEIYISPHRGEAQVKHEINDLIAQKVSNIDRAIQARYRRPIQ